MTWIDHFNNNLTSVIGQEPVFACQVCKADFCTLDSGAALGYHVREGKPKQCVYEGGAVWKTDLQRRGGGIYAHTWTGSTQGCC